jgi:hypothetical protein
MTQQNKHAKVGGLTRWSLVLLNVIILKAAYLYNQLLYWWLLLSLSLLFITIIRGKQRRKIY